MRRRIAIALLLGSTAIVRPAPAEAMPQAAGFIIGALGGTAAATAGAAYAAGVVAGGAFAGTALGAIVVKTVVGVGLSMIAQALTPRPDLPKPSARMVNFAQGVAYAEWALGRVRKGGPIGFTGAAGTYRYYVPILAAHEIAGIAQHYLDERPVEIDGADLVTTDPIGDTAKVSAFLGAAGQAANADLLAEFPGQIAAAHDFAGLAGAVIRAKKVPPERFSEVYPGGRQWAYAPVLDGHARIYDPRSDSYGFTSNAALILAWWLTERMGQSVNWDLVAVEADVCDEEVTDRYGVTGPRWCFDGILSDDQDFETQRAQLCGACDAFLYEAADGTVGFYVGRYMAPGVTLADGDFEAVELVGGQTGSDAPTEIVPEYVEPANAWREWSTGVWTVTAEGRRVRDTPQLHGIKWHNQAIRIAARLGRVKRPAWQLSGTIGAVGYELLGHRFFRFSHAELGIDGPFEIGKLERVGVDTFSVTANSVAATDWDFDAGSQEPERPAVSAEAVVGGYATAAIANVAASSPSAGRILVGWDAADAVYSQQIRLQRLSDGFEEIIAVGRSVAARESYEITGCEVGATYAVQVRNFSGLEGTDKVSAWAPAVPIEVTVSGAPTGAFSISSATGEPGQVRFQGNAGANTVVVTVWRAVANDFGTAVQVGGNIPVQTLAAYDVSASVASGTAYYWLRPIAFDGSIGAPVAAGPILVPEE
ncbi:phage tail protein [Marinibacterium profundimaris]|uniref:hypothetical protein n=1 Tax=Marinibacterium profundimaris TaxID=1679460 RepID=UPI000B520945|nr:hypothetical protein [Marinibacterium profundimaris]